jgi:hypothetical protein
MGKPWTGSIGPKRARPGPVAGGTWASALCKELRPIAAVIESAAAETILRREEVRDFRKDRLLAALSLAMGLAKTLAAELCEKVGDMDYLGVGTFPFRELVPEG